MIPPEFTTYIRQRLAAGSSRQAISSDLMKNGWSQEEVNEGFRAVSPQGAVASNNIQKSKPIPNRTGRKLALSASLIFVSIAYAFYQNIFLLSPNSSTTIPTTSDNSQPSNTVSSPVTMQVLPPTPVAIPTPTVVTPKPAPTPAPVVSTPPPVTKPKGQYADGTYTGPAADAYYGNIQVQAVVQNGKLSNVIFLQHPSDRGTSVRINNYAMPILKQEAISAQSANVDIVSGATDSSQAFQQSLGSALAMAKN